ncbi:MAG: sigma-54 dependent transcriptional regulator [FCB group bacterium]|jgi:transcriptional regulator with GAF, ATPase, and Fis domain
MSLSDSDTSINHLLQLRFGIIGKSKLMQEAVNLLMQAAPTDLSVLITGETGTGKEIFANALHGLSERKKAPFISVNCGAIPETLLESELFGHEKGAFTSAVEQRKGFFEVADKGTIFLDEIGEMPYGTQVKLLRVLESGEFTRLGSTNLKKVDVRLVAATNRELEYDVRDGKFRQDLYFRLKSVHLYLPPLRKHIEDIPLLTDYFGEKVCDKLGIKYEGISEDALNIMRNMPWPGNVRELRNLIETTISLQKITYITPDALLKHIAPALPPANNAPLEKDVSMIPISGFNDTRNIDMEIIFRSLLELKNDITDIKRYLHSLNFKFEDIRESVSDSGRNDSYTQIEEIPTISEDNLKMDDMERKLLLLALRKFEGNRRLAAKALGLSERTLYRKISNYGITE